MATEKTQTVLKVQLPLKSSEANPQALAYNYDRSIEAFMPVTQTLLNAFEPNEVKAFFTATVEKTDEGIKVELVAKEKMRDW